MAPGGLELPNRVKEREGVVEGAWHFADRCAASCEQRVAGEAELAVVVSCDCVAQVGESFEKLVTDTRKILGALRSLLSRVFAEASVSLNTQMVFDWFDVAR